MRLRAKGDVGLKRALEEEFDLDILDLMLPGMDGFEGSPGKKSEKSSKKYANSDGFRKER